jgi:hypothetical protein
MKALQQQSKITNRMFLDSIMAGSKGYWRIFEEAERGE